MKSADHVLLRAMRAHPWPVGGMAICAAADAVLTLSMPVALATGVDAALRGSPAAGHVLPLGLLLALSTAVELGYGALQGRAV
ncbi:MAG TPA: hypothetical protein VFV66_34795, partial [Nonomuraea sp.]|nr:hypothetical protein [Nonomuraea sp.]